MIKGTTIGLWVKTVVDTDPFGQPVYSEVVEDVKNVLIGEPSADDITTTTDLYGKKLAYTLAIPKGDEHIWEDTKESFFGETFATIGKPTQGIEANIPGPWNKKVKLRYLDEDDANE